MKPTIKPSIKPSPIHHHLVLATLALLVAGGCGATDEAQPDSGLPLPDSGLPPADSGADAAPACASYKPLSNDISVSVTLDGCYLVTRKISVNSNALLTIAPGSVLVFQKGASLTMAEDGSLKAEGSASRPILLTAEVKTPGHWGGLLFHNSDSADNSLDHVTVEYAGGEKFSYGELSNIALTSSGHPVRVSITNTRLRRSAGYGFFFDLRAKLGSFANNTITENAAGAGFVEDDATSQLDASSTYSGNTLDHVRIAANTIAVSQTWPALDVPYLVDGIFVLDQVTLTLAAGATLKLLPSSGITVADAGALVAKGTTSAPVTFTWAQVGKPWRGILFHNSNSASNLLEHVVVEHGGGAKPSYGDVANIALTSSGYPVRLTLSASTIRSSAGYGVWVSSSGNLTESGNSFSGNAKAPDVYQQP